MVDNYEKGEVRELEPDYSPFSDEFPNATFMKVKPGSKLHSLVGFAEKQLQESACHHIVFAGVGQACTKAISAVEVLKRRLKFDLHQITRARFKRVEEYWDPKVEGLERLKVNRDIPAIYVLLSKESLAMDDPGYQGPSRDIPLLRSDKAPSRRQQQQYPQNRSRNNGGASSGTKDKDANRWRRNPKGSARDKKPASIRHQSTTELQSSAAASQQGHE